MDMTGWCLATLHRTLGHDRTAMFLGVPAGDKEDCIICEYGRNPTEENHRIVVSRLKKDPSL